MKCINFTVATIALAAIPAIATAEIDYSSVTAEVVLTSDDITGHTGQTTVAFSSLGLDSDGNLYLYSGSNQNDPAAELLQVDISGSSPQFTTIATEAQLVAHMDNGSPIVYHTVVASDGTIYIQEWIGSSTHGDDILQIVPGGGSPSVTNIRSVIGVTGLSLSHDETNIIVSQSNNFLAPSNNLVMRPVTGGSDVTLASQVAIRTVTGATEAGLRTRVGRISNGNYVVWDESGFQGSDQLLEITPSGDVSIRVAAANVNPGFVNFIISLDVDGNDAVFLWNDAAADKALLVLEDAGAGTHHKFTKQELDDAVLAATGTASDLISAGAGNNFAVHTTPSRVTLYFAANATVYAFHFDEASASAKNWMNY